jgi:hypothetical protein
MLVFAFVILESWLRLHWDQMPTIEYKVIVIIIAFENPVDLIGLLEDSINEGLLKRHR